MITYKEILKFTLIFNKGLGSTQLYIVPTFGRYDYGKSSILTGLTTKLGQPTDFHPRYNDEMKKQVLFLQCLGAREQINELTILKDLIIW